MTKHLLLLTASAGLALGACHQSVPADPCGAIGGGGFAGPGSFVGCVPDGGSQTTTLARGCTENSECPGGETCQNDKCLCPASASSVCGTAANPVCANTQTDPANCGACGVVCPTGELCNGAGSCARGCAPDAGLTSCLSDGGAPFCTNATQDPANCGSCGNACPSGQSCTAGACKCPATTPNLCGTAPNTFCTNTSTDASNCGACGKACPAGQGCNGAGVCTENSQGCASDAGFSACTSGTGATYCANLGQDGNNCGGCGKVCPVGQSCAAGTCNCPGATPNLCGTGATAFCTDTNTDANNCGTCGHACPAGQGCNGAGACTQTQSCAGDAGLSDCTSGAGVPYCANLADDASNCGSCGNACPAGESCADGGCACPPATPQLCGTAPANLCTNTQTDPADCGGCGKACATGQGCASGACQCPPAAPNLCGTAPNTLCTDTNTDSNNCGSCGNVCPTGQGCNGAGVCTQNNCAAGFTSCTVGGAPPYCANVLQDPGNCGACGNACAPLQTCNSGFCDCPPGAPALCGTPPNQVCTNETIDPANCGACGTICPAGSTCVNGGCFCPPANTVCHTGSGNVCTDTQTDPDNCGICNNACPTGVPCQAGQCAVFGNGSNGNLTINSPTTLAPPDSPVNATAGQPSATVTQPSGFGAGQVVLLQQTQGNGAGVWETATVTAVGPGGALTFASPLANSYSSVGGNNHAQALVVPQYVNVTIGAAGSLAPAAWNGQTGGILAFMASGTTTVTGSLTAAGLGFQGTTHANGSCPYQCQDGFQGESALGPGVASASANGAGGGGGQQGQDCGMGGGGAYGLDGAQGSPWGNCNDCCVDPHVGGAGGAAEGLPNLFQSALFGGAGGEGGADEDGAFPGAGGNGGGFIAIFTGTLNVTGSIRADGAAGLDGNSTACPCGPGASDPDPTCSQGCGAGGGGGGAGGAIQIVANSASLGSGLVTSNSAGGGLCSSINGGCGILYPPVSTAPGGPGSVGRIAVSAASVSGTTSPAFDPD